MPFKAKVKKTATPSRNSQVHVASPRFSFDMAAGRDVAYCAVCRETLKERDGKYTMAKYTRELVASEFHSVPRPGESYTIKLDKDVNVRNGDRLVSIETWDESSPSIIHTKIWLEGIK